MRKIVFDTETVDIRDLDMFDFGYVVSDENSILAKGSYLTEEVFGSNLYKRAYYFNRNNENYLSMLKDKSISICPMAAIRNMFNQAIVDNKVTVIAGFIIDFDIRTLNYNFKKYLESTTEITIDKLSEKFTVIDIPILFAHIYANRPEYKDFCKENDYFTDKGNYKSTAEVMYRFISGNNEHEEEHTAMNDCIEEGAIFDWLIKEHNLDENSPVFKEAVESTKRHKKAWSILGK